MHGSTREDWPDAPGPGPAMSGMEWRRGLPKLIECGGMICATCGVIVFLHPYATVPMHTCKSSQSDGTGATPTEGGEG